MIAETELISLMSKKASESFQAGHNEIAEAILLELLSIRKKTYGINDVRTLSNISNLAIVYIKQSKFNEAITLLNDCLKRKEEILG